MIQPTNGLDRLLALYAGKRDDELREELKHPESEAVQTAQAVRMVAAMPIDLHRLPGMQEIAALEDRLAGRVEPTVDPENPVQDLPRLAVAAADLVREGKFAQALAIRRRLCRLALVFLGEEHRDTATYINGLGRLCYQMGNYRAARMAYERALDLRTKNQGEGHTDTAITLAGLGRVLEATGEYERAAEYHRRALAICERELGPGHPDTAVSLTDLGCVLETTGDYPGAKTCFERALAIMRTMEGEHDPNTAIAIGSMGGVAESMGDTAIARSMYEESLATLEKALGPDHPDTAWAQNNLGSLLLSQQEYAAARAHLEQAAAVTPGPGLAAGLGQALMLNNLGTVLHALGENDAAAATYRRALSVVEPSLGGGHPAIVAIRHNLAMLDPATRQAAPFTRADLAAMIGAGHPLVSDVRPYGVWYLPLEGRVCPVAILLAA